MIRHRVADWLRAIAYRLEAKQAQRSREVFVAQALGDHAALDVLAGMIDEGHYGPFFRFDAEPIAAIRKVRPT